MFKNRLPLLHKLIDGYERCLKPICKKLKLPQTALTILLFLENHPECYTAKDISRSLSMKPSIVSFHVDKLVLAGYLQRMPIPEDRRQVRLLCTQKAAEIIARGQELQQEFFLSLTEGLSREDLSQLQRCLDVLASNAASFEINTGL